MIEKGWIVEEENKITVYSSKPEGISSYEAIVKIIPIDRSLEDATMKIHKSLKDTVNKFEQFKKTAENLKREMIRG